MGEYLGHREAATRPVAAMDDECHVQGRKARAAQ